jgi:lysozyme
MITWGLDTSHWEGTNLPLLSQIIGKTGKVNNQYLTAVHFDQARRAGARFALIKATDGVDVVDSAWTDSSARALASNLVVFPYHFYENMDPYYQCEWFISQITGKFSGVPVVDYEVTPTNPQNTLLGLVEIGQGLISNYHLTPLLYTSPYYLSLFGSLDLSSLLIYNLFLAWWSNGFITSCYPWAGYLARQWTDRGKLPGVKSSVDLDYMLDDPNQIVKLSQI